MTREIVFGFHHNGVPWNPILPANLSDFAEKRQIINIHDSLRFIFVNK